MLCSRRCLEVIVTDLCEIELQRHGKPNLSKEGKIERKRDALNREMFNYNNEVTEIQQYTQYGI